MKSIFLKSPSKLNLYLRILGKRKDRFHELVTVFEKINLFDEIKLTSTNSGKIVLKINKFICPQQDNIAFKTASLIFSKYNIKSGLEINIKKNIPVGAGLGGGSSDAASVIVGLNKLYKLRLSLNAMLKIAAYMGSDVPFFVQRSNFALGTGRGEKIEPIKTKIKLWHVLLFPGFSINTKDIYSSCNIDKLPLKRLTAINEDVKILTLNLENKNFAFVMKNLYNDLEKIALKQYNKVGYFMRVLQKCGVEKPLLTGSGSVIFGTIQTRKEATKVDNRLRKALLDSGKRQWGTYIVHTL